MPRHRTRFTLFSLSEQRYAVGSVRTLLQWELNVQFMFSANAQHENISSLRTKPRLFASAPALLSASLAVLRWQRSGGRLDLLGWCVPAPWRLIGTGELVLLASVAAIYKVGGQDWCWGVALWEEDCPLSSCEPNSAALSPSVCTVGNTFALPRSE